MNRKGSAKANADAASPIPSWKTSIVDLTSAGSYDECLEALKQADDDAKRATIMS